ncbi:MAG: Gldg family protein, partial [Desulfobacula sp.]
VVIIHGDLVEKIEAVTSTQGLEYQLTTAIQKMNKKVSALLRLDGKVSVSMYLSSSLNAVAPLIGLDQFPVLGKAVTGIIEQLNTKSLGVLDFKQFDISGKAELDAIGKKYELMALSWPALPEKNIPEGSGAAGIVIEYKGKTATLPLIKAIKLPVIGTTYQMADPVGLEADMNAIVEKLIGINKDLGYLSGHGTLSLMPDQMAMMQGMPSESLQAFNTIMSSRYGTKPVDLKTGSIPDGLNCLIIARPTEKMSDYELFQIDQALMKGTNIAFISDSFIESQAPPGGMGMPPAQMPIDTGLEKLLHHYGIDVKKAYVLDKQCYKHQAPKEMGGGEQSIYFAPMLKETGINTKPDFMNNIKGIITMQISPLELVEENIDKEKITATKLFSSSDESWLMEGMINLNPMFIRPPETKAEMKSYDLAYLLSGTFTSYFKGKALPEKETGKMTEENAEEKTADKIKKPEAKPAPQGATASYSFLETSKPAKLFVLPCSQMLQDNMLDPEGQSTNAMFILNIIDHLNGEDDIAMLRSKQQTLNPIARTTPFDRGVIKAFNIIGLPILVILFGLGVFVKRRARKKKIANRFNI